LKKYFLFSITIGISIRLVIVDRPHKIKKLIFRKKSLLLPQNLICEKIVIVNKISLIGSVIQSRTRIIIRPPQIINV